MAMVALAEDGCPARGVLYTKVLKVCPQCKSIDLDEMLMVRITINFTVSVVGMFQLFI